MHPQDTPWLLLAAAQLALGAELPSKDSSPAEITTWTFDVRILICLAAVVGALAIYRVVILSIHYVRTLTCLNNPTQKYFMTPSSLYAFFKEHMLYAPMFRKRHNREFRLSSALHMGMLPTRFQSIFLACVLGMNAAFCLVGIDFHQPYVKTLSVLRNRTGSLAVVNLIPLVVLAARNNPLIALLNISFDNFNLVHRWFGRIVVAEAVVHMFAWGAATVHRSGWKLIQEEISDAQLIMTGFIGIIAFVVIFFQSLSIVRHAFYETFLHLHIALVVLALVALWFHLHELSQQQFLLGAIVLWAAERLTRFATLIYRNVGGGGTKAVVEALPGDALRVTLKMARPWIFRPGQHMYLYMPSVGMWTNHPFSVAWSEEEENPTSEKGLAISRQDILASKRTEMSLIIRRRTGFTTYLHRRAERADDGKFVVHAFVEGPYGGLNQLQSYGTVMMFAGGVGITHQIPHVRELVAGFSNSTVAARRVVLVWVVQSPEHLEWIRPWMTTILAMDNRREILRILLFVTQPRSTQEIHSPSATVQMFPGRPNVDTLIGLEADKQIGAMGVSVCGPGALSDDVRLAVRKRQAYSNIDFVEESFSW